MRRRDDARPISKIAPQWWDYTTLDDKLLADAARLDERKLQGLSREGFQVHFYDTAEDFFLAEALEYIDAWRQSSPDDPAASATRSAPPSSCRWSLGSSTRSDRTSRNTTRIFGTWASGSTTLTDPSAWSSRSRSPSVPSVPARACTVGPVETWKAEKVSIWHPGHHDNPFGIRLTALMIGKGIVDTSVPMSLLTEHPNVHFHYLRPGLGTVAVEMR